MPKVEFTPELPKNESGEGSILKIHFALNDDKGDWNGSMTLLGKKLDIRITVAPYTDPWASFDMDPRVLNGSTGKMIEVFMNDVPAYSATDDNFGTDITFLELYTAPSEEPDRYVEIGYHYKIDGRLHYEQKAIYTRIEAEGDSLKITRLSNETPGYVPT